MRTFKDLLRLYNNQYVVPALEVMQKLVDFYQCKGIEIINLGCTLPSLANNCLHKSTTAKFYPFTESDNDLLEKLGKDMVGRSSIEFTRKFVVDKIFVRDSTNWCNSIIGNDTSQLYPFCMWQATLTGLYTRCELDSECGKFKRRQNKTRSAQNMVMSYFLQVWPQCKRKVSIRRVYKKTMHTKLIAFMVTAPLCLKPWDAIITIVHFRKLVVLSLRKKFGEA